MSIPPGRQWSGERDPAYMSRLSPPPAHPRYASPCTVTRQVHVRSVRNTITGEREDSFQYRVITGGPELDLGISSGGPRGYHPSNSGRPCERANPCRSYESGEDLRLQADTSTSHQRSYPPRYENGEDLETSPRDMSIAHHRQRTFEQLWDHRNEFEDTRVLVDCGFYCIGQGDAVECFHCRAVIANWSWHDSPWTRHRQRSPGCRFLNDRNSVDQPPSPQRPGRAVPIRSFSTPHQRSHSVPGSYQDRSPAYPSVDPPRYEDHEWSAPSSQYRRPGNQGSCPNYRQNLTAPYQSGHSNADRERIFHLGMESGAVRAARDAGYAEHLIREVQWTNVCNRGTSYRSAEDLLVALRDRSVRYDRPRDTSDTHLGSGSRDDANECEARGAYYEGVPTGRHADTRYDTPFFRGEERLPNAWDSNAPEPDPGAGPSSRSIPGGRCHAGDNCLETISSNENVSENAAALVPAERKRLEALERKKMCKICFCNESVMVFYPCGHLYSCEACSERLDKCCLCRADIGQKIKSCRT